MLFLCVLPVGYAIVWVEPSWHCGPFSGYKRIYYLATTSLRNALPNYIHEYRFWLWSFFFLFFCTLWLNGLYMLIMIQHDPNHAKTFNSVKCFRVLDYIASPGIVIPLIVLMALIIYYMVSLTNSLRESNNDLKVKYYKKKLCIFYKLTNYYSLRRFN